VIDSQEGIKEPLGMSGVRLEAKVHVVTCAVNAAQNIEKCMRRCNLEVEEMILEQLASSYAVLTDDERELGVCLVDIGGGTTDIAIFRRARSATPASSRSPATRSPTTSRWRCARRRSAEEIKIRTPAHWPSWPAR
jgi:cell division protein FtsA